MSEPRLPAPNDSVEELTPRQREVLALLAKGRTNFEIAEALGLSLEGAKYHVREITGRLGVESREEAAEWWRRERRLGKQIRRRFAGVWTTAAAKWLGVAVASGGVVGFAVFAYFALANGGSEPPVAAETPASLMSPSPMAPSSTPATPPASVTPSAALPAERSTPIGGDPAALTNGRLVVYSDEVGGGATDIVTFDLDRGRIIGAFRLTNSAQPKLVESSRKLYIIEDRAIVERNLDGSGRRVIYQLPSDAFFNAMLPSPDGSLLAIGIEVGQQDPQGTKLIVVDISSTKVSLEAPLPRFSALGFYGSPAPDVWDGETVVVYGAAGKDGTVWPTARVTPNGDITIVPPLFGGPANAPIGDLAVRRAPEVTYPCMGIWYGFDAEAIIERSTSKTVAELHVDGDFLEVVRWSRSGDAVLFRAFPLDSRDGRTCAAGIDSAPIYFVWEGGVLSRVNDVQALLSRWDGDRFLEIECQGAKQRPDYPLSSTYLVCDNAASSAPATIYLGGQRIDTVRQGAILGFPE
ncbi:MAG: LuxR C-terminal-related transcriptional regulator [Dehalococcoidia bacterium]